MTTVSVVIPVYNRASVVETAVRSALAQTLADIEVIVVDDGSTDGTKEVVGAIDDGRLRLVGHRRNRGGSTARNTGIRHSSGEYIALLDSDDAWHERKLEAQVAELRSRSDEWIAAYCGFRKRRQNRLLEVVDRLFARRTGLEGSTELIEPLLLKTLAFGGGSTLLVTADAVAELDGFDESFERHQDVEFLLRLLQLGRLAYVDEILVDINVSAAPSGDAVVRSTTAFNRRFDDVLASRNLHDEVRRAQNCMIAKHYLSHGRFAEGFSRLIRSRFPHARDVLGIGLALAKGVQSRTTGGG